MLQRCELSVAWWHLSCLPKARSVIVHQASQWPWLTHEPCGCWSSQRKHRSVTHSTRKYIRPCRLEEVKVKQLEMHRTKKSLIFPASLALSSHYHDDCALHLPQFPLLANSVSSSVASASMDFLLICLMCWGVGLFPAQSQHCTVVTPLFCLFLSSFLKQKTLQM